MNRIVLTGLMSLIGWSVNVQAQENLKATAQVRYRFQTFGRDFNKDTNNFSFSQLRSRLGLDFTASENLTLHLMLQDSRILGEELSTLTDGKADALDMREGFMKVNEFFWSPLDMKLGRMRVKYGEERLIGPVDWHNIGRSFDGVVFTVHDSWFSADIFAFAQVEGFAFEDSTGDLNVLGFNWDLRKTEQRTSQVYLIWQLATPSTELNRLTAGYYVNGKIGNLEYTSNGAYQGGELTDSLKHDIQAYMFTFDFWYRFANVSGKPGVSAGVDYLSGDADPSDCKFKVFDTLYATNHKFYGFMDYFLNIPRDTSSRGLVDAYARALVHLGPVPVRADLHVFQSAQDFTLSSGGTSRNFGVELDLTLKHVYNENLTFVLGGSVFDPGDIFKDTTGSDLGNWAYLMLIANI